MRELDDTDRTILEALAHEGRRSYSDIGDEVGLSGPAVSERVSRMQELGVLRRFTVDVDRSQLGGGTPVLVELETTPAAVDALRATVADSEAVEYVLTTAEASVTAVARVDGPVEAWVGRVAEATAAADPVADYSVTLLSSAEWTPTLSGTGFALTCAECGNTVTSEGESAEIGGRRHRFCCESCLATFRERHERIEEGAD
jgi:Lrp/AsnC family leucine-responsive transcriptional regulator